MRDGPGDPVVAEVEVHQAREVQQQRHDSSRDGVVSDVEDGEAMEPNAGGDGAGDAVSDDILKKMKMKITFIFLNLIVF